MVTPIVCLVDCKDVWGFTWLLQSVFQGAAARDNTCEAAIRVDTAFRFQGREAVVAFVCRRDTQWATGRGTKV